MPYIITTSEPFNAAVHVHRPAFTRTAATTLDEARNAAYDATLERDGSTAWWNDCATLPEAGGTVGPLPDGIVIEVQPVTSEHIVFLLGRKAEYVRRGGIPDAEIIAAFNAQS